jgi:membrane protease YdiL (CAAX protease family)
VRVDQKEIEYQSNIKYDGIREFCLCERIDENYLRSQIRQGFYGVSKTENQKKFIGLKNVFLYAAVVLLLFVFSQALGKAGGAVADMFSYKKLDPDNAFAPISVHHVTIMLLSLVPVFILRRPLKSDFGFCIGNVRKGTRFVLIYTAVFAAITLVIHVFMLINNSLPVYDYPLNTRNILGTLGFQLLLSGPAEEIVYRALPITILARLSVDNRKAKQVISTDVIIASFLFAIAHIKWSLSTFAIEADYFQLIYAFAQGIISGKLYKDSRSAIYPMMIHSISNVLMVGTGYLFLLNISAVK